MIIQLNKNKAQHTTAGHTPLPGRGVANVGSFGYLSGKPTRMRPETLPAWLGPTRWQAGATAYTGGRWTQLMELSK